MTDNLIAKCRLSSGGTNEVEILDINEAGCLVRKNFMRLENGDRLLIKLPSLEHMVAYVAWAEDDQAGFTFEQPLYGPVLQHILSQMGRQDAA